MVSFTAVKIKLQSVHSQRFMVNVVSSVVNI